MRRSFTALIALMLALSMLLGIFVGCTKDTPDDTTDPTDATDATDGTEKPTEKPTDDGKEDSTDDPGKDDPVIPPVEEDDGPRKTPIMGWASWNAYHPNISEAKILSQAEKLVEYGLANLGYTFVNIDDGWQYGRVDGVVQINEERFPNGMKYMSDTLHSMGLKAGIYSDVGRNTCGAMHSGESQNTNVGLYGYEVEDLRRYLIEWDYDFIKVDWCGGGQLGLDKQKSYTKIAYIIEDIEYETGEDKIYNVCCWEFPGEWVVDCADSWRTGADITNDFESIVYQINRIRDLAKYHGPGHVNDLDMLQIGNGMSYEEDKTHFAMWCMMSTPLMLGMDLNCISDETLSIISNAELIAINQDVACIQAAPVKKYGEVEAWTKDLGDVGSGRKAIALLNTSNNDQTVTVDFSELGLEGVEVIRDLWAHEDIAISGCYTVTVPAHGTCVFTAEGSPVATDSKFDDNILKPDGSSPKASMSLSDTETSVDLSALGSFDWAHFSSSVTTKKENGAGEITLEHDGTAVPYASGTSFNWSDAAGISSGSSSGGMGIKVKGDMALLSFPCDQNTRTATVFLGATSANAKVELIVGGKLLSTEVFSAKSGESVNKTVSVEFSSDQPTTAYIRVSISTTNGLNGMVGVNAAALSIAPSKNTVYEPEFLTGSNGTSVFINYTTTESTAVVSIKAEDGSWSFDQSKTVSAPAGTLRFDIGNVPALFNGNFKITLANSDGRLLISYAKKLSAPEILSYNVGPMTAKNLIADGALLIDVRSASEFAEGHIEGAINIEYTKIAEQIASVVSNKNTPIILYCSAAKRSTQALRTLVRLGYTRVYNLGSMSNYYAEPTVAFSQDTCTVLTADDLVDVVFIASPYDSPEVYISAGVDSTFADAVPLESFSVPSVYDYYYTIKAYLVQDGVCHAEVSKQFIYWDKYNAIDFAGDMKSEWISSTTGWGSINIDKSVDGNKLSLDGTTFSKGIGAHATSEIVMNIPEDSMKFLAVVGQDDEIVRDNPGISDYYVMIFYVYIDGELADRTAQLGRGQSYVFDIDIPEGAKKIKLVAHEGSYSGKNYDHADWAIAGFFGYPSEG
ncbi:MAG: NPCBM/NEW2 domain-containing protein [Clostridia bacterium]|nr:NPCBM/NEW2 domain-containing protein [Clostridia bacterium]